MDIILKYFPNLSEVQQQQFAALYDLYTDWNSKINVISRKDITNLYEHHVLHSLGIAKVMQFRPETTVMDLGTGGGFPGIPLAILFPETHFHLVDSIGKKVKVATEIANAIGLKNVTTRHCRAEEEMEYFVRI
jgi:16S rRNA (guanine527-N7)-methyltransferase